MLDHVWIGYVNLFQGRLGCFRLCQIMSG